MLLLLGVGTAVEAMLAVLLAWEVRRWEEVNRVRRSLPAVS